jgi:YVTN family beta-propeller protein
MKKGKIYLIVILLFLLGVGYAAFHKWSVDHVLYMTGGVEHPIGCVSCHVAPERDGFLANMMNEDYLSPINATVNHDGSRLYVVAQDADQIIEIDLATNQVISRIQVGDRPHTIEITSDDKTAIVSNQWANNVFLIDLSTGTITDTIPTGGGPAGMDISPDGKLVYIANTYDNSISVIDIESREEIRRYQGGNYPTNVTVSPSGDVVYVSSQRTIPVEHRAPIMTEVTVINTSVNRVSDRRYFQAAHIMESIEFTPQGDMAVATLVRPKNLVPSAQIEGGWMINHGIGIAMADGRMAQFLLDEPNEFYPDPYNVVIHPNGKLAYVSHSGVDMVSVVDLDAIRVLIQNASDADLVRYANHLGLSSQYVVKRIKTGSNPKGMAISPDGKHVYVVERMMDRISVIDTEKMEIDHNIYLGGPSRITLSRLGGQQFSNASHTYHNQYSCYTCHPDGHEDGLTYDLTGSGRNLANVQTLRDLNRTAPFKWIGTNQSVYKQCGMRFSIFVTRTESFSPKNLDAIVAYIFRELTHPPNLNVLPDGEMTDAQKRGRAMYYRTVTNTGIAIPEKDQCITCHNGPSYNSTIMSDVGSLKDNDDPTLFDPANLNNVYESAPYLHDGSAATLEEIWTKFNPYDTHGYVNDMTKDQLNDLVEYLKALPAERYYTDNDYQVNTGQLH